MTEQLASIEERHGPVRSYPMAVDPQDGHTYTAIVEQWCERCHTEWPCDAAQLLTALQAATGRAEALRRALEEAEERGLVLRTKAQRTAISNEDWRYTNGYDECLKRFRALAADPISSDPVERL